MYLEKVRNHGRRDVVLTGSVGRKNGLVDDTRGILQQPDRRSPILRTTSNEIDCACHIFTFAVAIASAE